MTLRRLGRPPRACRILRDGRELGYLGEGGGPFATACRSVQPDPVLERFRYTSLVDVAELEIAETLAEAPDFDSVLILLDARGLATEPLSYADAFGLAETDAPVSPVMRAAHQKANRRGDA